MDEGLRQAGEAVLPQGRLLDGFKEAMRVSEEAANRLREGSAEAGGDTIASVERYEVGLIEVEN